MKHFIRLTDFTKSELLAIFAMADELREGRRGDALRGKSVLLFFPDSSLRTRVTFQRGINLLGGQSLLFTPETLEKREELRDVMGYMANWVCAAVARHRSMALIEELAGVSPVPVINAMTDENHPCEVMGDIYAVSKTRDFESLKYAFFGPEGNMALAWREAAGVFGLNFVQSCPDGLQMSGVEFVEDPRAAMAGADVILTDSRPSGLKNCLEPWQITPELMNLSNPGAILNPCPPFFRGEEVSAEAIADARFAGYAFKKCLVEIQQAIILYCMNA